MTWLDILLLAIWIIFLAVGAKLGSVWIGSCVLGGFLGTFLADTYALPMSSMMGGFAGSVLISTVFLFAIGLAIILVPGWFLSRATNILLVGMIDSAVGMLTGAVVGLVGISLFLLMVVPAIPKIEKQKSWKKSFFVRPYHEFLEDVFHKSQYRPSDLGKKIKKEALRKVKPAAEKASEKIIDAADEFVDDLKK